MPLLGSDLCMSTNLELPVCSCCKRHIMPNDKCVKFRCPNCDDGDLILTVHFQKHELFERRGSDLFCNLPIEWSVAVLGGTIEIPTLEGSSTIRIPSGTQSQKIIRLSGRGLPIDEKWTINSGNNKGLHKKGKNKRGDIHYTIQIEVPINITPTQRKTLQQLQKEIKASTHPKQYTHITEFQMYMQNLTASDKLFYLSWLIKIHIQCL